MRFEVRRLVRFAHTDPSGIVFYPRYFEMINNTVEDWFADGLGVSFARLHSDYAAGVPTVHTECSFLSPSRLGEVLTFTLAVSRIGRSSLVLDIEAHCAEHRRVRATVTLVYTLVEDSRLESAPLPADLREQIERYRVDATTE